MPAHSLQGVKDLDLCVKDAKIDAPRRNSTSSKCVADNHAAARPRPPRERVRAAPLAAGLRAAAYCRNFRNIMRRRIPLSRRPPRGGRGGPHGQPGGPAHAAVPGPDRVAARGGGNRATATVGETVRELVAMALTSGRPLAVERLDFSRAALSHHLPKTEEYNSVRADCTSSSSSGSRSRTISPSSSAQSKALIGSGAAALGSLRRGRT